MELMQMAEQTGEVKNREWRGKVGKMMEDEFAAFLAGNPFCRLGCLDEEGWPYVVPCWFEYSDEGFYIIPRARSAWASCIQHDPRVFPVHRRCDDLQPARTRQRGGEGSRGALSRRTAG